jgi:thiosulfate reductase cytochrome b subunit
MDVIAAVVWHFWIAVVLTVGALIFLIATTVGYLHKVSRTRYPRQ